ncbi:unnamed protein product, partial [Pylaiella littoralis]
TPAPHSCHDRPKRNTKLGRIRGCGATDCAPFEGGFFGSYFLAKGKAIYTLTCLLVKRPSTGFPPPRRHFVCLFSCLFVCLFFAKRSRRRPNASTSLPPRRIPVGLPCRTFGSWVVPIQRTLFAAARTISTTQQIRSKTAVQQAL